MTKVFVIPDAEISSIEPPSISSPKNEEICRNVWERNLNKCSVLVRKRRKESEISSKYLEAICTINNCNVDANTEIQSDKDKTLRVISKNDINMVTDHLPIHKENDELYLSSERKENERKEYKRNERFKSIILNGPSEFSWIKLFLVSFGIILGGVVMTIPITLIPYHDLVQSPDYWFEHLLPGTYCGMIIFAYKCSASGSYMNIECLSLSRNMMLSSLAGCAYGFLFVLTTYYTWTSVFAYQYPIPLLGFAFTFLGWVCGGTFTWFLLPKKQRRCRGQQKRMGYVIVQMVFGMILATALYFVIICIIRMSSDRYQPIAALALPAYKEIHSMVSSKLLKNAANGDAFGSMLYLKYVVNIHYVSNLCIVLGSIATNATSWVLMGVDYAFNMWLCFNIVRKNKSGNPMIQEQIDTLVDLALCEQVEFHVPLAFISVFAMASYGPNSGLFGGIGSSRWGNTAIGDIDQAIENMLFFFLIDFSSTIASAVILWFSCRINLWKAFNELQKEFRKIFCFFIGFGLTAVRMKYIKQKISSSRVAGITQ